MIRENKTKRKLNQGEPVCGVVSVVSEPIIAEIAGVAGFDFFMVDGEHGPITPAQAAHMVRACEAADITPLVRVGPKDAKLVLQYLNTGMMGVMMPGLETVAELEALVSAVKYPPLGDRGMGFVRTVDYLLEATPIADYLVSTNAQTLVIPQFEDISLLERLPEMAAVEGVDGFVIGPIDLSLSMGFAGNSKAPEVQAVIDQAIDIIRGADRFVGITASTGEIAQAQIARGASMIINSIPNLIGQSSRAFLDAIRNPA